MVRLPPRLGRLEGGNGTRSVTVSDSDTAPSSLTTGLFDEPADSIGPVRGLRSTTATKERTMTEPATLKTSGPQPGRNLALELVRLTEAAALAAGAGSAAATRTPPTAPRSTRCAA